MEEPSGDYLTVDMTADVEGLAGQAMGYIEELSR
jgi:hypothetical protein